MQLTFLPVCLDFNPATRAVRVTARYEGRTIDVLFSRDAVEYLARAEDLDKNAALTVVVRNKQRLSHAAELALARYGDDCAAVTVALSHLAPMAPLLAQAHRARATAT
jgi:glutaminase